MKIIIFAIWLLVSSLFGADNTVGFNKTQSKTTNQTAIGSAIALFDDDVACVSIFIQALGANTADIFIAVDANKNVGAETSDAISFTLAAREPLLFRNMDSGHLFLYVTSGTMGTSHICEQGQ